MSPPNVLQYQTPPAKRSRLQRWSVAVWAVVWVVVSTIIWRMLDWHGYVYQGPGLPMAQKFELPLWFQLGASLAMGSVVTAVLGIVVAIRQHLRAPR